MLACIIFFENKVTSNVLERLLESIVQHMLADQCTFLSDFHILFMKMVKQLRPYVWCKRGSSDIRKIVVSYQWVVSNSELKKRNSKSICDILENMVWERLCYYFTFSDVTSCKVKKGTLTRACMKFAAACNGNQRASKICGLTWMSCERVNHDDIRPRQIPRIGKGQLHNLITTFERLWHIRSQCSMIFWACRVVWCMEIRSTCFRNFHNFRIHQIKIWWIYSSIFIRSL